MSNVDARFIRHVETIAADLAALLIAKQGDYGAGNINNAYGGALNGLLVRMGDKYERIKHLTANSINPANEPLIDSFKDLANYSIIALMVLDGRWPTNEGEYPCESSPQPRHYSSPPVSPPTSSIV